MTCPSIRLVLAGLAAAALAACSSTAKKDSPPAQAQAPTAAQSTAAKPATPLAPSRPDPRLAPAAGAAPRVQPVDRIVAVVNDVKHRSLDAEAGREVYIPMGQAPGFFQAYDLVVRATDPVALVPSIRSAIWAVDSNQALGAPVALEAYIGRTLGPRRLLTGVIGVFAGTTLLLAALGVYGVVRYRVAQQVKEIAKYFGLTYFPEKDQIIHALRTVIVNPGLFRRVRTA